MYERDRIAGGEDAVFVHVGADTFLAAKHRRDHCIGIERGDRAVTVRVSLRRRARKRWRQPAEEQRQGQSDPD